MYCQRQDAGNIFKMLELSRIDQFCFLFSMYTRPSWVALHEQTSKVISIHILGLWYDLVGCGVRNEKLARSNLSLAFILGIVNDKIESYGFKQKSIERNWRIQSVVVVTLDSAKNLINLRE